MLAAHRQLMLGLLGTAGNYRQCGVGVMAGTRVLHMAPLASQLPRLMDDLFGWLARTPEHPLIASAVFHYEFEFIHPFADGNGRMGRLWQTLLLLRWRPLFADLPVDSLVHRHQAEYYQAIQRSTVDTDSAPFIAFMLRMIRDALLENLNPQVSPQVTPPSRRPAHHIAGRHAARSLAGGTGAGRSQVVPAALFEARARGRVD